MKFLNKNVYTFIFLLLFLSFSRGQSVNSSNNKTLQDSVPQKSLDEILVSAVRATEKTPMAFSNLDKRDLAKRNLGQDLPSLMNFMTSVVTTTDAGNGIGYSGIRVRGSDATRVNVTINGIPYNDSESQGTFWVNMPDFTSSLENIQLQRGVGTSTNGSAAFGASLNLLTDQTSQSAYGSVANSFGSYNSRKHTVKFSSGLLDNSFELSGRLSEIRSDGYIDRASSNLKSYFLQGSFIYKNALIKALAFGGDQVTYQAWNGLEDPEMLLHNRTFNTAGLYYDADGNQKFYANETDNYKQDHYQLHWNQKWTSGDAGVFSTNLAFHYTKGFGFYENYKANAKLSEYDIAHIVVDGQEVSRTDLVRLKFLDNHFYGLTFSGNYQTKKVDLVFGGAANRYEGDHYGQVKWSKEAVLTEPNQQYYFDTSVKNDVNSFVKINYQIHDKLSLYGDLQYRYVSYDANGLNTGLVQDTFHFLNPKAGLNYQMDLNSALYFSYAKGQREPNRTDYENGSPKPEVLNDFELGWRYASDRSKYNVNVYYMRYKDQLVLTGAMSDVGAPLRENSGDSYRLGIELDAVVPLLPNVFWNPNITLSSNKNVNFKAAIDGAIQDLGNTSIAFSPAVIASNTLMYIPVQGMNISLLTKFVGSQFMGNTDAALSKLDSYYTNDISFNYTLPCKKLIKSIVFSLLLNNIFDVKYNSNGFYYTYDDNWTQPNAVKTMEGVGYYPQATFNMLGGVTFNF